LVDIEKLAFKHRLFKDGQLVVTKIPVKCRWDSADQADYDGGWSEDVADWIPRNQPLIVLREGTTKAVNGHFHGEGWFYRSIIVFYHHSSKPKLRKILINPLYGPGDMARIFTFGPEE